MDAPDVTTLAELLRVRASATPEQVGYTFLVDGEQAQESLTYGELDARATAVAARLQAQGAQPGDRAVLLFPPGLDFVVAFFGCLHAGVVAVPTYPPDPMALERTIPRLRAVLADSGAAFGLTTAAILGFVDELARHAPEVAGQRWVPTDGPAAETPAPVTADGATAAVLQYTSGSTSTPRGVVLSHANLLHNSRAIRAAFGTGVHTRGLSWLPPYHDMGLIGGLIQPLHAGCPVVLMSPLHFLEQPLRWLAAIGRHGATVSGGPNFAFELCVRRHDPAATPDLSTWEVAFNGAEPVRPDTLRRFAATFAPHGFRAEAFLPCYGLAESTLIVTGASPRSMPRTVAVSQEALARHRVAPAGDGPAVELASCGTGGADQDVAIVDQETHRRCGDGAVGEIWVRGPSVADGYWQRPAESAATFGARTDDGTGPYLRTGDLGFLDGGELVVTGRRKDLLIVRGRNHYPHDVELSAEQSSPDLRPGCSAAFLTADDDRLVVVVEARRQATTPVTELADGVRAAVSREQGLQVDDIVVAAAGGVPKTSSGKVARWRCRELLAAGELPELGRAVAAPESVPDADTVRAADDAERTGLLTEWLAAAVAGDGGLAGLPPDRPLVAAGLDSLGLMRLRQRVEAEFGVAVPLADLMAGAGIADVAEFVLASPVGTGRAPETAAPEPKDDTPPPVSPSQRWMWVLQQLEPDSTVYAVAVAVRLVGAVDDDALRGAVADLVARHAALRTTFPVRDGVPVQRVAETGAVAWTDHDARGTEDDALRQELGEAAHRPFDLEQGPLLRISRYRRENGDVLLLAMHHIVTDFWSMSLLARDLGEAYAARLTGAVWSAAPEGAYVDFVRRQHALLDDPGTRMDLERFWDGQVGAGVPGLELPSVPRSGSDRGGAAPFVVPAELTARLTARARAEQVTLHVLLLAAYQSLLHGWTGQPDLAVGVSATGRTQLAHADVVGCCTNPVMVRSTLAAVDEPFRDVLARTRDAVTGALEHQDYPTIVLAGRHRAAHRGRLIYEALFTFNRPVDGSDVVAAASVGVPGVRGRVGPLEVESVALPPGESTRPLEVAMAAVGDTLHGQLRYGPGALDAASAARFLEQFTAGVLPAVADDPSVAMADLTCNRMTNSR